MEQKDIELLPTPKFIPAWTRGDREFKGHGPRVQVSAKLYLANGTQVWARVQMRAVETVGDWTTAEGAAYYLVYDGARQGEDVRKIVRILGKTRATWSYVDDNEEDDISPPFGEDSCIDHFECTGDTQGDDAGIATGVVTFFNPITIEYIPKGE